LERVLDAACNGEFVFDDQDRCGHTPMLYPIDREGANWAVWTSVIRCAPFPGAPAITRR
jgi:hypothetical protein